MSVDILSTLNRSGSGLNITTLSTDLASAEIAPRKAMVQTRIDSAETSLGALDVIRGSLTGLRGTLTALSEANITRVRSDSPNVSVTVDDASRIAPQSLSVGVQSLAQSQVLEFRGFSSAGQSLGMGNLTVDFGTWDADSFTVGTRPAQTISLGTGATLQDLADSLNGIDGIMARIVDVGDGTVSLGILSETGASNALRIANGADPASPLQQFDMSAGPGSAELRGASDAIVTLDGIAIRRQTNEIDDAIPGATLTLRATTLDQPPATISAGLDTDLAAEAVTSLMQSLNEFRSLARGLTARGTDGAEAGPLAGDAGLQSLMRSFDGLLARGYDGLGDQPVFLSDFGLITERDGSLRFDRNRLDATLSQDSGRIESLLRGALNASSEGVSVSGRPLRDPAPGRYDVVIDANTNTATIGGVLVQGVPSDDGRTLYAVTSGPLSGLSLTVDAGTTQSTIDYGPGPLASLGAYLDEVDASGGILDRRETAFSSEIAENSDRLIALDQRMTEIEARYRNRFTEMERVITQLNSTGEYLTSLMDSWNADN